MSTVTISIRVSVPNEDAADVSAALVDKGIGALSQQTLAGSVMAQTVYTDEDGSVVRKSKVTTYDPYPADYGDEDEDL